MSDQAEFDRQLDENRRAYEALRDEFRAKYADQYVAIAFGRIVAVDPDYFRATAVVDGLDPKPVHSLVFLGADDPGFEPVSCAYQGEPLPCDESAGEPPPTGGTPSTSPSGPSTNP